MTERSEQQCQDCEVWFENDDEIIQIREGLCHECGRSRCEQRIKELEEKYNDLLLQVGSKYPGESRHETAKRYIYNWEHRSSPTAGKALSSEGEGK